jgi:Transposase DDE domain
VNGTQEKPGPLARYPAAGECEAAQTAITLRVVAFPSSVKPNLHPAVRVPHATVKFRRPWLRNSVSRPAAYSLMEKKRAGMQRWSRKSEQGDIKCCPNMPSRRIVRDVNEGARDVARALAKTEAFEQSRRDRKRVEMLFAHLKRILRLARLRLRGPCGAQDEFTLAAIAQNLRRLAKLVARPPPAVVAVCVA